MGRFKRLDDKTGSAMVEFAVAGMTFLVLGVGGLAVIQSLGPGGIAPVPAAVAGVTTGTLVAFLAYMQMYLWPNTER